MNIQQALVKLEKQNITNSIQMIRRWIKQGKIEATLPSRKEGFVISDSSLNEFIKLKKEELKNAQTHVYSQAIMQELDQKYAEGFKAAKENQDRLIEHAIKEREKELILKGLKEDSISYTTKQLLHGFKQRQGLSNHLLTLGIQSVSLNILGSWIFDEQIGILFDYTFLPYPNRKIETRVKDWYVEQLWEHLEKNK